MHLLEGRFAGLAMVLNWGIDAKRGGISAGDAADTGAV